MNSCELQEGMVIVLQTSLDPWEFWIYPPPMRSEVTDCKRLYRFGSARSLRSFSVNILGEWMMTSITLGLIGRKGSSSPDTEDAVVRSFHCKRTR